MGEFINNTTEIYDATPSYKMMKTMGFGSYTLETAISDIVDNSITAKAKNINLNFKWFEETEKSYVEIIDDGVGMDSKELLNAMIFSGKGIDDERTEDDLGKYGLGLKTASLFACKCLTVISKKEGHTITAKRLDQDLVDSEKSWVGIDLDKSKELKKIKLLKGTIVRWDKLNFVDEGVNSKKYFLLMVDSICSHLSLYFHRFLESDKLTITVNGRSVKPWNPTGQFHLSTNCFENKELLYKGYPIIVKAYILPSTLKCSQDEIEQLYRDEALKRQGFYVYRNNRLLVGGGWLSLKKLSTHQQYNSVRITIEISSQLDSDFKIDFTKSSLKLPKNVENEIVTIAQNARAKASENSRNWTRKIAQSGIKTNDEIWNIKRGPSGYTYEINKNHPLVLSYTKDMSKKDFNALIKVLSKSVPILSENRELSGSFSENEINSLIEQFAIEHIVIKKEKPIEVLKMMANMEPFNFHLELLNAYFEKEMNVHA